MCPACVFTESFRERACACQSDAQASSSRSPADWVASCCWQRVSERESSRSAEMEEELSTVRRQISLLVQVEGVSPRARGAHPPSPAAPRGGAHPSGTFWIVNLVAQS